MDVGKQASCFSSTSMYCKYQRAPDCCCVQWFPPRKRPDLADTLGRAESDRRVQMPCVGYQAYGRHTACVPHPSPSLNASTTPATAERLFRTLRFPGGARDGNRNRRTRRWAHHSARQHHARRSQLSGMPTHTIARRGWGVVQVVVYRVCCVLQSARRFAAQVALVLSYCAVFFAFRPPVFAATP